MLKEEEEYEQRQLDRKKREREKAYMKVIHDYYCVSICRATDTLGPAILFFVEWLSALQWLNMN